MKKIFVLIIAIYTYYGLQAQTNTFPTNGNVGVGTTSPSANLHIPSDGATIGQTYLENAFLLVGSTTNGIGFDDNEIVKKGSDLILGTVDSQSLRFRTNKIDAFAITPSRYVGIGTISPKRKFHLQSGAHAQFIDPYALALIEGVDARLQLISSNDGSNGSSLSFTNLNSSWTLHQKTTIANNRFDIGYRVSTEDEDLAKIHDVKMSFLTNGNVGIGTTSPEHKLQVAGSIKATEIKVEAQTADFVFEDDYQLKSLEEVEEFIQENKHLPEIPSAKQMEEEGVGLAEMNKLLLQKVEELTLYTIEQQKTIQNQEETIKELGKGLKSESGKNEILEKRLSKLEALLLNP